MGEQVVVIALAAAGLVVAFFAGRAREWREVARRAVHDRDEARAAVRDLMAHGAIVGPLCHDCPHRPIHAAEASVLQH